MCCSQEGKHFLRKNYLNDGPEGNIFQTNIAQICVAYRHETMQQASLNCQRSEAEALNE